MTFPAGDMIVAAGKQNAQRSRHAVSVALGGGIFNTKDLTLRPLRYKKVANAEALIWRILTIGEKKFRRLNAPELMEEVYQGKKFVDGVMVKETTQKRKAA